MAKMTGGSGDSEILINHIALRWIPPFDESKKFYQDVLGFTLIKRPEALDFIGAWLCNMVKDKEVSIHLLDPAPPDMLTQPRKITSKVDNKEVSNHSLDLAYLDKLHLPLPRGIDPTDNYIAFKCDDIEAATENLESKQIEYMKHSLPEGEILFFHDRRHYMLGICNWTNFPVKPTNFSGRDTEKEWDSRLPLSHISRQCTSVEISSEFYKNYLGFQRTTSSKPESASWIYNNGISILLLKSSNPEKLPRAREIDSRDDHIAFNSYDMKAASKVKEAGIKYKENRLKEGEITVNQLFFHDPDNYMLEICSCKNFPVIPIDETNLSEK